MSYFLYRVCIITDATYVFFLSNFTVLIRISRKENNTTAVISIITVNILSLSISLSLSICEGESREREKKRDADRQTEIRMCSQNLKLTLFVFSCLRIQS